MDFLAFVFLFVRVFMYVIIYKVRMHQTYMQFRAETLIIGIVEFAMTYVL